MERTSHKKTRLTGLIIAVVAIAVIVIAVGSLCTCLCSCGSCFGCGCSRACGGRSSDVSVVRETEGSPAVSPVDHAYSTVPPRTSAPSPTFAAYAPYETSPASPVPTPAGSPASVFDPVPEATPLPTEPPTPSPVPSLTPAPSPAPSSTHYPIESENIPTPSPAPSVRPKQVQLKNDGTDTVTVLVLMNGSDLESQYQEATRDLIEMVQAKKSDRVNILVETVGTKNWDPYFGISSRRSERYRVTDRGMVLVDGSLGQLDTTVPSTLSDFIVWGKQNYPADRYILLLWDHGGGPVYGFGYDEYQTFSSTLTIDEMQLALRNGGVFFDMIGMDCCLMSSLEVCCAMYNYCDYMLLSEDFEPGCGWQHTEWLSALANDPAIPTPELAKIAIDSSILACENERGSKDTMTLALIDEANLNLLYPAWLSFAYANEETLLSANYSQMRESTGRAHPCITRSVGNWFTDDTYTLSDYCITDILSLAANIPSDQSDALWQAFDMTVVYFRATTNERTLAGLSVTLPYGDPTFYDTLRRVFRNAGLDEEYITWLGKFTEVDTGGVFFDFSNWNVWVDYIAGHDWGDWVNLLSEFGQIAGEWLEEWGIDVSEIENALDWLFGN